MLNLLRSIRHGFLRRNIPAPAIPDELWRTCLTHLPFLAGLPSAAEQELRQLCAVFLKKKVFTGAQGFEPDNVVRLSIAIQACLPVLRLGLEAYSGWSGIVVYPGEFVIPRQEIDEAGVQHDYDEPALGEAWAGGPVILSWFDDPEEYAGANVVIHEFAHKLDLLNGDADGCPPLHAGMDPVTWKRDLDAACADINRRAKRGHDTALDPYAGEDPAEFFAVASESFFVEPDVLKTSYPAVYRQLVSFYRQDPASWR